MTIVFLSAQLSDGRAEVGDVPQSSLASCRLAWQTKKILVQLACPNSWMTEKDPHRRHFRRHHQRSTMTRAWQDDLEWHPTLATSVSGRRASKGNTEFWGRRCDFPPGPVLSTFVSDGRGWLPPRPLASGNCRPMWGKMARHQLLVGRGVHRPNHSWPNRTPLPPRRRGILERDRRPEFLFFFFVTHATDDKLLKTNNPTHQPRTKRARPLRDLWLAPQGRNQQSASHSRRCGRSASPHQLPPARACCGEQRTPPHAPSLFRPS